MEFSVLSTRMQSTSPMVSVIIPVYNGAAFITRAVDSVLAQSFQDVEIIIIDDGSLDNTQMVLDQFSNQPNIRCYSQDNAGPAHARNTGIQSAKGEFIAFLDCDDIWLPDKLETQVALLRGTSEPGLVHSDYEVIDPTGKVIQFAKAGESADPLHIAFTGGQAPLLSTVIVSRALLEQVGGFDQELWVSEDADLILRLYEVTAFEWVDRVLVHKFQQVHGDADDRDTEVAHRERVLRSRERFLTRVQKRPSLNSAQQNALNRDWSSYHLLKGTFYEGHGRWSDARNQYREAIHKDPFRLRGYTRFLRTFRW